MCQLECTAAFNKLSLNEKLYAHYLSRASWAGAYIILAQTSLESLHIFELFQLIFSHISPAELRHACVSDEHKNVISAQSFEQFLGYAASFYGNMGNYLSFGDTKFVPRLPQDAFVAILQQAHQHLSVDNQQKLQQLLGANHELVKQIYSLDQSVLMMGYPPQGISTYYSSDITQDDIKMVNEIMTAEQISPYNTRLMKRAHATENEAKFELRLAAARSELGPRIGPNGVVQVVYGDYDGALRRVCGYLQQALPYVANQHQHNMIQAYIKSFQLGDIKDHKESQIHWVQDIGPVVESNIGFIESYRDPFGVRGEWEGFVAVVNKDTSAKFNELVNQAPRFLKTLPWQSHFEKDEFRRPDFTSLEVITFTTSGIPAGINIPNYDDIRQNIGFKNVSLGNVLSANPSGQKITFLKQDDHKLYDELKGLAFEVQVGCHELLGHGSGKLLMATMDANTQQLTFNFDRNLINPLTQQPIASWYGPGETYDSKFSALASTLEECRAECVGIYLSADSDLLQIFGFHGQQADDITYVNWLNMVRAGVLALEFYTPENKQWRQAHMQGRYAILRTLLAAGDSFVTLHDDYVELDRSKIKSVGVPAIAQFLHQIQVFKATADVVRATNMYKELTDVPNEMLKLRDLVLAYKQPRKIFVQAHTKKTQDNNEVELQTFEASNEGLIQSFVTRFRDIINEQP